MPKGDIVLIPFPFTDLSGSKLRPAIVLFESKRDVTVCFITSQFHDQQPSDMLLAPTPSNGIKKMSLIRVNKIATLDLSLLLGKIGSISPAEILELNGKLKSLLKL